MTALYRGGVYVVGQACDENGNSSVVVAARDSSLPPVGTATGTTVGGEGLRETVSALDFPIAGACVPSPASCMVWQYVVQPWQALAVITSTCKQASAFALHAGT